MKSCFLAFCLAAALAAPAAAQSSAPAGDRRPQQDQPAPQTAAATAGSTVPATTGTSGEMTANVDTDYRLGTGDKIRVEVYKEPQLSQSLQIRPDGKITMPFIGDMMASGLTPAQLRDHIGTALKDYVINPVVSVIVVETLASTVDVMGEVNKPGTIPLIGPLSVVQALARAGGFRDFANTRDIRILRQTPDGMQTLHFNYKDALKGDGKMVYLQRGDTVIVR